jgi:hypothetical protein
LTKAARFNPKRAAKKKGKRGFSASLFYKTAIKINPSVIAKQEQSFTLSAVGRFKLKDRATEIAFATRYKICPNKYQGPTTH